MLKFKGKDKEMVINKWTRYLKKNMSERFSRSEVIWYYDFEEKLYVMEVEFK